MLFLIWRLFESPSNNQTWSCSVAREQILPTRCFATQLVEYTCVERRSDAGDVLIPAAIKVVSHGRYVTFQMAEVDVAP
jgi:hypothetical protein